MKKPYICENCKTKMTLTEAIQCNGIHSVPSERTPLVGIRVNNICGSIAREKDGLRVITRSVLNRLQFANSGRLPHRIENMDGTIVEWLGIFWIIVDDKKPEALLIN